MTEPYNAAERTHVKAAARQARLADRARIDILVATMSSNGGRAWILDILERCSIFATTFTGDSLRSAFAEGQRNIGLFVLNDIMQTCPDQYVLMMQERNARNAMPAREPTNGRRDTSYTSDAADSSDTAGDPADAD